MRLWLLVAILSLPSLGLLGCSDDAAPSPSAPANATTQKNDLPPPPPPPPPPPVPSPTEQAETAAKTDAAKPFQTFAEKPLSATQDRSSTYQAGGSGRIRLSAGVALPQTGPEGILMSFGVDYVIEVEPDQPPFVLVIECQQGVSVKRPVDLTNKRGNLILMIQGWRPNEGPFQAHIEDKTGRHVSATVDLFGQGF